MTNSHVTVFLKSLALSIDEGQSASQSAEFKFKLLFRMTTIKRQTKLAEEKHWYLEI